MNWILIATPAVGIVLLVIGVMSLRFFLPLDRSAPSRGDEVTDAVRSTADMFGRVIGAAIRDERQRGYDAGIEAGMEHGSANHLEQVLSGARSRIRG